MVRMSKKLLKTEIYAQQAEICSALASPVRLMILDLLGDAESTASSLQKALGLPKSNLSQHIAVLKRSGILKVRDEGRYQYLSLSMPEIKQACTLVRRVLLAQIDKQILLAKTLKNR
jgi:DNA-binding transcriptional ArsR family regulator